MYAVVRAKFNLRPAMRFRALAQQLPSHFQRQALANLDETSSNGSCRLQANDFISLESGD